MSGDLESELLGLPATAVLEALDDSELAPPPLVIGVLIMASNESTRIWGVCTAT
jgi:hypothetical protein